jgi:hypothetical protein
MNEREELEALRRLAELEAKAGGQQTFAQTVGATLREIPRQVGLTARYGLEAFGQTALPDLLGLPEPQNANERVVGDASRIAIGAMGLAKGASLASQGINRAAHPVIAGVTEKMAENLGPQLTGAMAAGASGGAVREAGGGPTEQFIASVLGGVAGGLAYGPMASAASGIKGQVQKFFAPKDIAGKIEVELQRAGVEWGALSREAQAQLVKDAERALYRDESLDPQALARLAHFRNIGATPTRGAVTMDPRQVTLERNLAKSQANMDRPIGPDLAQIQNQNAGRVLATIDDVERSPADNYAAGSAVQGNIAAKDAAMSQAEKQLYDDARNAAGRDIPLDRESFVYSAYQRLADANKGAFLPKEIQGILDDILAGKRVVNGKEVEVPFTVDVIDNLKTTLATAQRGTRDGNVRQALSLVRSALEDVQPRAAGRPTGSTMPAPRAAVQQAQAQADNLTAETLRKFDAARSQARDRRNWQESAAFVEDALSGQDPVQFTKKHIINASVDDLTKLRTEIGGDFATVSAVRRQFVNYIMERGRADADVTRFTSAGMEAAFKQLGRRKLSLFFSPQEIQQIESAIKVAKYSQAQPIGSAVNNSNTGAMVIGRLLNSLVNAGQAAPVIGPMVAAPITGARIGLQARSAASVSPALAQPQSPTGVPINPLLALALIPPSN